MIKKLIMAGIVFLILFLISMAHAEVDYTEIKKNAVAHLLEHSELSEEQINLLYLEIEENPEAAGWVVALQYSPLSESRYKLIVSPDGKISGCNCIEYMNSRIMFEHDMEYCMEAERSIVFAQTWEKEKGTYQLWDAYTNAKFYRQFEMVPYETSDDFDFHSHFDDPSNEPVSLEDAIYKANQVLMNHFGLSEKQITSLHMGSSFTRNNPSESLIQNFYDLLFYEYGEEDLEQRFSVIIDSQTGVCWHAQRLYLLENEEFLSVDSYYSDVYYFVKMDDGSYVRNDQL